MDIKYPAFGRIIVDGVEYSHDVVIEAGRVRSRDKGPSKAYRARYGHTPLSAGEKIPWSHSRLIVGSGYSGRLPVMQGVLDSADRHGVRLEILPTQDACSLLRALDVSECNAILHVTC